MSEKINSVPVFTIIQEEKILSATITGKSYNHKVIEVKSETGGKEPEEDILTRIGTAHMQKDGSIYIQLYAMPLNGKLIIKPVKN